MSNILPMTIESLVALLLLLTILYCVRLNAQLKRLKADEASMRATIAELVTATQTAERAIAGLKTTVQESERTLGERIRMGEQLAGDLARNTEAGAALLDRLVQIVTRGGITAAQADGKSAADPKAIAAAAQAFTERTRARIKGLAA